MHIAKQTHLGRLMTKTEAEQQLKAAAAVDARTADDAEEDDDDAEEAEQVPGNPIDGAAKAKKKKKKSKKKKTKSATTSSTDMLSVLRSPAFGAGSKPPPFRGVTGFTDSFTKIGQTQPATVPIAKLYPDGHFPVGELLDHPGDFNTYRTTSEEKRALDRAAEDLYEKVRYASEVHRHVRKFAQTLIQPGVKLIDLCTQLENKNRELVEEAGFAVRCDVCSRKRGCWTVSDR